jgi:hypothetical protein
MELPSSPPTLPAAPSADTGYPEFVLPQPRPRSSERISGQKRRRDGTVYSNSSDPPIFSSDALDPSIDNYTTPQRQKRALIGPWFRHEEKVQRRRQRGGKFQRNFDSGVWMENNSSDNSSDVLSFSSEGSQPSNFFPVAWDKGVSQHNAKSPLDRAVNDEDDEGLCLENLSSSPPNAVQEEAIRIVERCIEEGDSEVDISGLNLDEIHVKIVQLIRLITLQSKKLTQPGPEEYTALTPDLRLYLANNGLRSIPGELCTLTNLKFLSLRNNKITSIPPQLGYLSSLECLNVSVNRLSYLPYSLHRNFLRSTGYLRLHDNKFLAPVPPPTEDGKNPDLLSDPTAHPNVPELRAMSTVCFYAPDGRAVDRNNPPPSRTPESLKPVSQSCPQSDSITPLSAPSLVELALRNSRATELLRDVEENAESCAIPPSFVELVGRAIEVQSAGGLRCDTCGRDYIVPRAEWLEWWAGLEGVTESRMIPFLVQVCGWSCVRQGVMGGRRGSCETSQDPLWRACGWRAEKLE